MNQRGFTLIEIMVGLIITCLIGTSLWRVFYGANKNAYEIMANHGINESVERIIMKISDEIRESNIISDKYPKQIDSSEIVNLKTDAIDNCLEFTKIEYDFSIDPSTLPAGAVNYTQKKIKYFLEPHTTEPDTWVLFKQTETIDSNKNAVDSQTSIFPIFEYIKRCVFYRLKNTSNSRQGSVYMDLEFARKDSPYSNYATMAAKERGACPEF